MTLRDLLRLETGAVYVGPSGDRKPLSQVLTAWDLEHIVSAAMKVQPAECCVLTNGCDGTPLLAARSYFDVHQLARLVTHAHPDLQPMVDFGEVRMSMIPLFSELPGVGQRAQRVAAAKDLDT